MPDGTPPQPPAERPLYRAFISYSHADKDFAAQLHKAIESYRIPSKLVGKITPVGETPARLTPIFRDRDELPVSGDLGAELHAALDGSMFQIVICSRAAAKSRWVGEEIKYFKRRHGESRVLALIVDGEPGAADIPGHEDQECFPTALKFHLGPDGELSEDRAEPLAADIRPHADGRRLARMKLIAGLTGLRLDDLVQREAQRRTERFAMIAAGSLAGMVLTGALAIYANAARIEADKQRARAEREADAAKAASDYLVNTFALADPATENPRTITAVTILGRVGERARTELKGKPAIQGRLMGAVGKAYNNLGLIKEAQSTLEGAMPQITAAGPDGALAVIALADTYMKQSDFKRALATVARAESLLGPDQTQHLDERGRAAATRGRILHLTTDFKGSIAAFDKALGYYRIMRDAKPEDVARVLNNRGIVLADDGQYQAAERSLQLALGLYRRHLGEAHLNTGQTWYALAMASISAGNLSAAEPQIRNALAIERRVLDPTNPILAQSLTVQGQVFAGLKQLPQAEASLREAISIYRRVYGRPHFLIGITEVYLGEVQAKRGNISGALATFDDAKHNYDVGYGKLHANHGDLLVYRARALAGAGRPAEARADCAKGVEILTQTLGAKASYTQQMTAECAKL